MIKKLVVMLLWEGSKEQRVVDLILIKHMVVERWLVVGGDQIGLRVYGGA